ncbi:MULTISPECIES: group II intron maturase-specific domain-containing protein [Nocardia]|uniref:group II intron maturase-specific domain-containing protein n=1 Tax=Nocardia TaxID=1817 RepID=UPI000A02C9C4
MPTYVSVEEGRAGRAAETEDDPAVEPNQPLDDLVRRVNATTRGWCGYFRPGASSAPSPI